MQMAETSPAHLHQHVGNHDRAVQRVGRCVGGQVHHHCPEAGGSSHQGFGDHRSSEATGGRGGTQTLRQVRRDPERAGDAVQAGEVGPQQHPTYAKLWNWTGNQHVVVVCYLIMCERKNEGMKSDRWG